ncbi:SIP domain-containing protein [Paeniglutamicibacter cryotolerans]|uniref:Mycobactin import ATP-binding/permease protein IrtA n=1 Tax=Paeniglutamicibacter cryotolerans TaxID=670079 RepID=A0A839QDV0_9MICC|nr:SIP domain-containing protein [Paeniglutamicibacter cryotolerans]MBB2994398.1 iron complex transport system ATP-binding protein [Paeniglutamicibacter cryotolerans]
MPTLEALNLSLAYGSATVVEDFSLVLPAGKITIIVGANGCGKSTLLRGLSRLLKPAAGTVLLDGADIHSRPAREVARVLGLLPQAPSAPDGITVRELVGRGRYPHQGWFRRWSEDDDAAVEQALSVTGTTELAERPIDELSGGQRQRVWIAMALAQDTGLLLLDEPTTYLDVAHQLEVLDVIAELNRARGTTVVIVLHDLNLAARYADHLVALKLGGIAAQGHPSEVITEEVVSEVFGMRCKVIQDPVAGTPLVLPIGRHQGREPGSRPAREICPTLAFDLEVGVVDELGPGFRRITLTGAELEHFGTGGHPLDLRVKALIPMLAPDGSRVPVSGLESLRPDAWVTEAGQEGWYRKWLALDEMVRGSMRTYTVRALRPAGDPRNAGPGPEIDLDFVLHLEHDGEKLAGGPAAVWAAGARPGDRLMLLGPNAALCGPGYGGIEFRPGAARRILLAGDETAAPAICSILESLPAGLQGKAFIEVPEEGDIQHPVTGSAVNVHWLARAGRPHGELLSAAVRAAVPTPGTVEPGDDPEDFDVDAGILWETSEGSGADFYAWLAGEAGMIKELRRHLVRDAGIDGKQVSFMGYWRRGRAEG